MKRIAVVLLAGLLAVGLMVACNDVNPEPSDGDDTTTDDTGDDTPEPEPGPAEINVRLGSIDLADGTGEYVIPDTVLVDGDGGYVGADVQFIIENLGEAALAVSSVSVTGADAGDFDLDASATAPAVEPMYPTWFTLSFDPLGGLDWKSATVVITNDDADESEYTFTVYGCGAQKLTASAAAEESWFGGSAAVDGTTMVVGAAQYDQPGTGVGAVYIYDLDTAGTGLWAETKMIQPGDGVVNDWFGGDVAVSGDTVAVSSSSAGYSVYLYYRDQGGTDNWGQVTKLTGCGSNIDLDGDTLVAASGWLTGLPISGQGAANIFERDNGGADNWGHVKQIVADDAAANDRFGASAAVDGDIIVIGAHGVDGEASGQGAVYVFYRDQGGAGNWGQVAKLMVSPAEDNDFFGISVGVDGDTIVVGTANDPNAYVFRRNEGGTDNWGRVATLSAADTLYSNVAICGDVTAATSSAGDILLYGRDAGGTEHWGMIRSFTASDGLSLGNSVGMDATWVVGGGVGAENYTGTAYVTQY